jgi:type III restriction enzyme
VLGVTTSKHIENMHQVQSNRKTYEIAPYSVYTLGEFVRDLANSTKLSLHTTAQVLQRMPADKFAQIAKNETRALAVLKDIFIQCIYALIINKVTYQIREVKVKTALTDATGALLDSIAASAFGNELHLIGNTQIGAKSLFNEGFMPVHSQAERDTVDESMEDEITVFAKLPNIKIPTPMGEYNPDFGYVLVRGDEKALYLVVETKGYDTLSAIGQKEKYKIDSAKRFFVALKERGVNAHYKTKINQESLSQIVQSLQSVSL